MELSSLFTEAILPFLLVFVITFAILQKAKVLGDGKAAMDALVSLAIGLILIGVPFARDIVVNLMPWIAVGIAVILTFLILYGFVGGEITTGDRKWMKVALGILVGIFTLAVVAYVTGLGELMMGLFSNTGEHFGSQVFLILIVVAVFVVAIVTGKSGGAETGDGKGK